MLKYSMENGWLQFQLVSKAQNLGATGNETETATEPLIELRQADINVDNENVLTTEDHPMKKDLADFTKFENRPGTFKSV